MNKLNTQHSFCNFYLLEANNLIIHVLLLSVVTWAEGEACNTQQQMGRWYVIPHTVNTFADMKRLVVSTSCHHDHHVWFLILSPEAQNLTFNFARLHWAPHSDTPTHSLTIAARVEMFVFPHAQGLFEELWRNIALWSESLGCIWKTDRQRFKIFLNTNQYSIPLKHLTPFEG